MKKYFCLILLVSLVMVTNSLCAKIWYVSEGGRGAANGLSWADAAADIKYLLPSFDTIEVYDTTLHSIVTLFRLDTNLIQSNYCQPGDTIFVSEGTYSPLFMWHGQGNRNRPTIFKNDTTSNGNFYQNDIKIFGGFEGSEHDLSERVLGLHPSIIDGRDQNFCVWIEGRSNVILDGFTLQNGIGEGSAIRAVDCSSLFSNLTITANRSDACTLYFENVGKNHGNHGVDFVIDTVLPFQLTNTLIYGNNGFDGLLIKADNSDVTFLNNTIANNVYPNEGGGQFIQLNNNSVLSFKNSIIWNNYENRILRNDFSSRIMLYHSGIDATPHYPLTIIYDDTHCFAEDPLFVSSTDYHVSVKSYAVNNGDYAEYMRFAPTIPEVLPYYDLDSHPRTHDNKFVDIGACQSSCNYFSCYPGEPKAPNYNVLLPLHSPAYSGEEFDNNDISDPEDVLLEVYSPSGLLVTSIPVTAIDSQTNLSNGLYIGKYVKNNTIVKSSKIVVINGEIYQ